MDPAFFGNRPIELARQARAVESAIMSLVADDLTRYRHLIDQLVERCRNGAGQISAQRIREGIWNRNSEEALAAVPEQVALNRLLRSMSQADRDLLAGFFSQEFAAGVATVLGVLYEEQLPPFDHDGYEGTPNHDFSGRMADWPWPSDVA